MAKDDRKKTGPEPDRLKIEGDWKEALQKTVRPEADKDQDAEGEGDSNESTQLPDVD